MNCRLILLAILVTMLAACASSPERTRLQNLDKAIDEYAYALRWSRVDDAVSFHAAPDGSKPVIDQNVMKPIRVTGFRITHRQINPEGMEAEVTGELTYYHNDYGTLRTQEYHQNWWYDEESEVWLVDSEFPEFR